MSKRAALYIRVSTEEQAKHGYSLAEQKRDLSVYAVKHDYSIVDVYADEGLTARKAVSRRKELQRLLKDVQDDHIDIIVMKCLDRWFRNTRDYYAVQDILDQHGVEWECTQEEYNTTTTNGRLMLNLKLAIAQNESDQTSDRIKYVFEGIKRQRGRIIGIVPIGYKAVDKHIVINEDTAPIIRFIFKYILSGKSMRSCVSAVNDKFHVFMSRRRIFDVLSRPTYIGRMYGIDDYCPAIISKHDFNRAQELLKHQPRYSKSGRIYLFSGLIKCPSCGCKLVGYKGTRGRDGKYKWFNYRCNSRLIRYRNNCTYSTAISEARVERYLISHIQDMIHDYVCTIKHIGHVNTGKRELASLYAKFDRMKDLYIDGMIEKVEFDANAKPIKSRIEALEKQQKKLHTVTRAARRVMDDEDFITTYKTMTREKKQAFWHSILQSISFEQKPLKRGTPLDFSVEFLE